MRIERHKTAKTSRTIIDIGGTPSNSLGILARWAIALVFLGGSGVGVYLIGGEPTLSVKDGNIQLTFRPSEKRVIPTPKELDAGIVSQPQVHAKLPDSPPLPRKRPRIELGHYWEMVPQQGDAFSETYERVKRRCIPKFRMPDVCYMPQELRDTIVVWPKAKDLPFDAERW